MNGVRRKFVLQPAGEKGSLSRLLVHEGDMSLESENQGGAPVISLANGGAESAWGAIENSCGRILSPALGETEIAAEVERLAASRNTLDLEAAAQWVREQYAPPVISARLTKIYEELAS